jgi:hypothetical protein
VLAGVACAWLAPGKQAQSCDITVRQAGFLNSDHSPFLPRPYELWLVAPTSGPAEKQWLEQTEKLCTEVLPGVNLMPRVHAVDTLRPEDAKDLGDLGVKLTELPRCYLVWQDYPTTLVVSESSGMPDEAFVRTLMMGPTKLKLKAVLEDVGNYCAILFVRGTDPQMTAAAKAALDGAIARHAAAKPRRSLVLLDLDRSKEGEAQLLAEIDAGKEAEQPLACVVFGKGRLLRRTARGEEITPGWIDGCVAFLDRNASDCTDDPVFVREDTVELLMQWEPELSERMSARVEEETAESAAAELLDYRPPDAPASGEKQPAERERLELPVILAVVAGVLLVVIVAGWLLIRRRGTV